MLKLYREKKKDKLKETWTIWCLFKTTTTFTFIYFKVVRPAMDPPPPSVLPYETRRFKSASCLSGRLSRIYTTHAKQSTYNRGFLSELNGVKRRSVQERISVGCVFIILFLLPSLDSFIRSSKLSNQHNHSAGCLYSRAPERESTKEWERECTGESESAWERE